MSRKSTTSFTKGGLKKGTLTHCFRLHCFSLCNPFKTYLLCKEMCGQTIMPQDTSRTHIGRIVVIQLMHISSVFLLPRRKVERGGGEGGGEITSSGGDWRDNGKQRTGRTQPRTTAIRLLCVLYIFQFGGERTKKKQNKKTKIWTG